MRVPSAWLTLAALLLAIACGTAAGAGALPAAANDKLSF